MDGDGESSKEISENESEAFQKCGRRGRRGACTNNDIPTEKLADILGSLKVSEKDDSAKSSEKEAGT